MTTPLPYRSSFPFTIARYGLACALLRLFAGVTCSQADPGHIAFETMSAATHAAICAVMEEAGHAS